ncbi:reverse transcriptase domain-containing protein [Tanacetum coccineum]|uniref:Reverse transcriptase domain-containing protein n=1 Tax=Tanacetum coccineum TaxID=301880 RepID=A0ABQ5D3M9_9ASTR
MFTDGSSCVDGSGAGLILTSPEGTEFTYALRFQFAASNNEAEYEALIAGLQIAARMGVRNIQVSIDSKLVENQVLGTYIAKEENMIRYLKKTKSLISDFNSFSISQAPRSKNKKADALSKIASTSFAHLSKQVMALVLEAMAKGHDLWSPKPCGPGITGQPCTRTYERLYASVKIARYTVQCQDSLSSRWPSSRPRGNSTNRGLTSLVLSQKGQGRTEAVIPVEIGMPTYCTVVVDVVHNDEELRLNLDLLEERRECAVICEAKAKSKMRKYYNARVRGVTFKPRDFVYRSNDASHAVDGGKLGPKWEGPYEVTEALGDGAYKLRSTDRMVLPRTWNIANLKKCYL